MRRGRGFSYQNPDGTAVTDAATLQRIKDLVIPPAWKKVWICAYPNGHIQAAGTDAAGRRQYLYHQKWQDERNEEKFDRVLEMSAALPDMRRRIAADLRRRGLARDRVVALALHILDLGYFRAGGEQYAEENNSYRHLHAVVRTRRAAEAGRRVRLPRQERRAPNAADRRSGGGPVRAGTAARRDRTERLLVCRNGSGWTDLHADDLNARFKELVGDEYTVKDLRTWHGTVLAAAAFVDADPPVNKTVIKRVESAVMKEVAEELGNTPAVARSSYVDPRVVEGYESGLTIAAGVRRAEPHKAPGERQAILENSTARLIRKVAKG